MRWERVPSCLVTRREMLVGRLERRVRRGEHGRGRCTGRARLREGGGSGVLTRGEIYGYGGFTGGGALRVLGSRAGSTGRVAGRSDDAPCLTGCGPACCTTTDDTAACAGSRRWRSKGTAGGAGRRSVVRPVGWRGRISAGEQMGSVGRRGAGVRR